MSIFMTGIPEEKEKQKEIGIHAVRGGTIVGEHSVIFAGNDEIIEINTLPHQNTYLPKAH